MKPVLYFFLLFPLLFTTPNSPHNTHFFRCNTIPDCNLNDLYFIGDQTGWAVGDKSAILKTTDSGKNWENI